MPVAEEAAHFTDFTMAFQKLYRFEEYRFERLLGADFVGDGFQGCTSLEKADLSSSSSLVSWTMLSNLANAWFPRGAAGTSWGKNTFLLIVTR